MKYQIRLEIPANTDIDTPTVERFVLPFGILKETKVYFPWGCAGLAHVRVLHNERVLYPTSADEWFEGNDIAIIFECLYKLSEAWTRMKVEGYNEDNFYSHTPIVSFVVLPTTGLPFNMPVLE